ncbi:SLBB domain-containing protein [Pseudidiomarina terrestris]|uniref:SLBB domain-containing protein n=1 Tax=Pseudidiomarina terrestris TaxID=2820060 RepID=UPI002658BF70|nr:SLBB domain-containing protein [Pseudidiomarina sp. 1APR75-33.1]
MKAWLQTTLAAAGLACLLFAAAVTTAPRAQAQDLSSLTPQQIQQIQKLPRAQQEAIARQFGVNLSDIEAMMKSSSTQPAPTATTGERSSAATERETVDTRPLNELSPGELAERLAEDDKELQPFGYNLFQGEPSTFAPMANAPVPSNYLLGVGDSLRVQLYGKENRSIEAAIDNEGRIVIENLGPITVAGLRYDEAKALIQSTVRERMIGMEAAVSMGELRSMQIFVVGEAYKPGAYTVSSLTTMSQALFVSGGVSDIASLRNVQLKRNGKTVVTFDLYKLLTEGDASNDLRLQAGDVVFIPTRGDMVSIAGEVLRPAIYEMLPGETLADALSYAGGLLPTAYRKSVQLQRISDGSRRVQTIDLTRTDVTQPLQGGDAIKVLSVAEDTVDSVMLVGAAVRPGVYEWRDDLTVQDILPSVEGALLPITDLSYGIVVRRSNDRRMIKVLQFDVAAAINGVGAENLSLEPRDQVVVFSRYEAAQAEENQLSAWLKTESDRAREERERVLDVYRKQYLQKLITDDLAFDQLLEQTTPERSAELDDQLSSLFAITDEREQRAEDYYAKFSRHNLLQPILYQLRNQYSSTGTLPLVYIDGEVRYPGIYPLVADADAQQAIVAAGGLKESAYLARAEITRTVIADGEASAEYRPFNLAHVLRDELEVPLKGRDRIQILSIPQWQNTLQVRLEGEVRFPGTYTIRRGETLEGLLERAGGLTEYAFIDGAIFTRVDLRDAERRRLDELAQQLRREIASNVITDTGAQVAYSEMNQLLRDLTNIDAVGRLIIDLKSVIADGGSSLQLKDGDRLHVPTVQNTVSIIGEVQLASSYQYQPGVSLEDYIQRAGGMRQKADDERIYIVKANGRVTVPERRSWFASGSYQQIEPGDTIVVPMDTQYMNNIEVWTTATQIMYQVGVALAALSGL